MSPNTSPAENLSEKSSVTRGMTTKVVKGSIWTALSQVAPLLASLVATPFTIRLLGSESYGVLVLIGLIPAYLGFADFGMNFASTKFSSQAYSEGDPQREASIVRTTSLIAVFSAFPFVLSIIVFSTQLTEIFNVPETMRQEARLALIVSSIGLLVSFLNRIVNTPQLTRFRMDLNATITAGFRIIGLIAIPIVIYFGGGILGAVLVNLLAGMLTFLFHVYVSGGLLPELAGTSIERKQISEILKFGIALVISNIAGALLINLEKGILVASATPRTLAYYSVAFTLASMLTMLSSAMIASLLPAFSQLQGEDKKLALENLFSRGVRIILVFLIPSLVVLALIAKPFFSIWAGSEFGVRSTGPFYLLLGGVAMNILAYIPYTALIAAGRTSFLAKLAWAELIPYALLAWVLTWTLGEYGAASAWSLRVVVDSIVMLLVSRSFLDFSKSTFGDLNKALLGLLIFIPVLLANYYSEGSVLVVLFVLTVCTTLYFLFAARTLVSKEELEFLQTIVRRKLRGT